MSEGGAIDGTVGPGVDGGGGLDGTSGGDASGQSDAGNPCGADLTNDKNNCGACGFDCSNGICAGGLCELSDLQTVGFVVDGTTIYAAGVNNNEGYVYSCATNGCKSTGAAYLFENADGWGARVREQAGQLYFANHYEGSVLPGNVYKVSKTPGGDAGAIIPGKQGPIYDFAFGNDGGMILFNIDDDGNNNMGTYACDPSSCADAGANADTTKAVAFDIMPVPTGGVSWASATGVWFCANGPSCSSTRRRVFNVPAQPQQSATALGYDSATDRIYFGETFDNGVGGDFIASCAANATDCTPVTAIDQLNFPRDIVIENGVMYFVELGVSDAGVPNNGQVKKCTLGADFKCTAAPTVIATGQLEPDRVALDSKAVYWSNEGALPPMYGQPGSLMKAPK